MWNYEKLEISHDMVRDEILMYLKEEQTRLVLLEPTAPQWGRGWVENSQKLGRGINELIEEIYRRLSSTNKIRRTGITVNNTNELTAFNYYYPVLIKTSILEELTEFIRAGILIQMKYKVKNQMDFDLEFDLSADRLLLTNFGRKLISGQSQLPYFAESYLNRLRNDYDPDEELTAYLSEGLACLRNGLGRASAILLRLAVEHVVNLLAKSIEKTLESNRAEKEKFIGDIRKVGVSIEKRIEVILNKLEHGQDLIPSESYFREEIKNGFRATLHSTRRLGGKAAHLASPIELEHVQEHYTLFASTIYPIAMKIIGHQNRMISTSP